VGLDSPDGELRSDEQRSLAHAADPARVARRLGGKTHTVISHDELNWRLNKSLSTGLAGEIGIHQIDTATMYLKARPVAVSGWGGIVAWQDGPRVVAQHVRANSTFDPAYPAGGLPLADPNGGQGDHAIVAAGPNGAIVTWTDGRDAATSGPDIYAIQVLATATLDVRDPGATALRFARPHPNPARDPLTLRYALAREAGVTLAVFDPSGRRVRQLVSGSEAAGEHVVVWDLRDERGNPVGAGVYFAELESGGESRIQKVMRVK